MQGNRIDTGIHELLSGILQGDCRMLARAISLVENDSAGCIELLESLPPVEKNHGIIGITGAPGAGKSTLVDALLGELVKDGKSVAVLCIDPSSPFHRGALLGDRIRMSEWYLNEKVFIRSVASRGSLGGLSPKIIETTSLLQAARFDFILVETVGVGQSEIEISGLADCTVVVMVPEGGDEVQTMKAGLMEIADIFVVNKSDRPGASLFVKNLTGILSSSPQGKKAGIPVIQTIATQKEGIRELAESIQKILEDQQDINRKSWLLTERAWQLIRESRMKNLEKNSLAAIIEKELDAGKFNLYRFVSRF